MGFVFKRVFNKLRASAQRKQLTTRTHLVRAVRALGQKPGFKEHLGKLAAAGGLDANASSRKQDKFLAAPESVDAAAKEERRLRRKESGESRPKPSPSPSPEPDIARKR